MGSEDLGRELGSMTAQGLELVTTAARKAAAGGAEGLDARHLLWAATREPTSRRLLAWVGADPDGIARKLEPALGGGPPRPGLPEVLPDAVAALADADRLCRSYASPGISPVHLLLALSGDPDSTAGRVLRNLSVTPESLQYAATHHPMA